MVRTGVLALILMVVVVGAAFAQDVDVPINTVLSSFLEAYRSSDATLLEPLLEAEVFWGVRTYTRDEVIQEYQRAWSSGVLHSVEVAQLTIDYADDEAVVYVTLTIDSHVKGDNRRIVDYTYEWRLRESKDGSWLIHTIR